MTNVVMIIDIRFLCFYRMLVQNKNEAQGLVSWAKIQVHLFFISVGDICIKDLLTACIKCTFG